jgi:endoglucanase
MNMPVNLSFIVVSAIFLVTDAFANCVDPNARVHLNQHGFYPQDEKRAILATDVGESQDWQLIDKAGQELATGNTRVFGPDPISGNRVHQIDFSAVRLRGDGLRIVSGCARSHPFVIDPQLYAQLRYDALAYF